MNYRHGYHAGNFADVIKHVALVAILLHLRKKDAAFAVIDSHAGRGLYDLRDSAPMATGEAGTGIARLAGLPDTLPGSPALDTYLRLVRECGAQRYPGSPLLAAKLLRPQDRLVAIEKHPEEAAVLETVLAPFHNAVAQEGDGYARLAKLLPPAARRGLVVIDPPFEAADEFAVLARALAAAYRKFATGIYLVWYPIKSPGAAGAFIGEALAGGLSKALTVEIAVAAPPERPPSGRPLSSHMTRAGVLVGNPPYGFAAAMQAAAALLAPRLGEPADIDITWRTGRE
jgi:23S rRNA (adenine2030-N6)-methyltransferase